MSSEKKKWSLYNQKTEKQVDGLKLSQVQAIISSLTPNEIVHWKAWHEGLTEWQSISKFAEFSKHYKANILSEESEIIRSIRGSQVTKKSSITKTGTEKKEVSLRPVFELEDDLEKSRLILLGDVKAEERGSLRYKLNMDVKVKIDTLVIECRTIDISLGGMWIDQQLPRAANSLTVSCTIERSGKLLKFSCLVVPDPKLVGSTRLIIKKLNDPELLRTWLFENS